MQPQLKSPSRYRTFILTIWEEVNNQQAGYTIWRFSLEHPHTAQRIGFKNLAALMHYLQAQIDAEPIAMNKEGYQ